MLNARPLLAACAALLLAGPAAALTITPSPVNHTRGGAVPLDADVIVLSIVGSTINFQLTVTTGAITRLDFSFLGSPTLAGPSFNFTSGGSVGGGGIGGTATDFFGTEVQVVFDEQVDAGESSGVISISFQNALASGYQGAITFDNGLALDEVYDVIDAPEPGLLALVAVSLLGVCLLRRR